VPGPTVGGVTTVLVGDDPETTPLVLRAAAAAGREVEVVGTAREARSRWRGADDVLVCDSAVHACLDAGLGRRPDVVVVTTGTDDVPWSQVLALGAEAVVRLPDEEGLLLARLSRPAPGATAAPVVGVVGGSGGAGASVLAAGLSVAAARRGPVLLVDADPDGPGADLVLGAEEEPGARWPELGAAGAGVDPATLRQALPLASGVHVLASSRADLAGPGPAAVGAVAGAARSGFGLVVVDLPRGRAEILDAAVPVCDVVLLVAVGDVRGATSARRLASRLDGAPLELVVRRLPGASLDGEALEHWLGLPVAAELPHDSRLVAALDRGDPPGLPRTRLAKVCDRLAARLVVG
jgi:secretion/DNA translocation related CpaE-like protein